MVSTGCFASHASSTPAAIAFAINCTARAGAMRRLSCCSILLILPLGPNSTRGASEALPTGPGQMTVTPIPLATAAAQPQQAAQLSEVNTHHAIRLCNPCLYSGSGTTAGV
eukprot:GHRQ01015654.1.p3 GENE.GHRQ01015654.1~~GHRQ01015654.1.p3  ORF type:complete len:111 (-),score=4.21 GHRQ01015654.1:1039-1371(-)